MPERIIVRGASPARRGTPWRIGAGPIEAWPVGAGPVGAGLVRAWLTLGVQLHAFRAAPAVWLASAWWRLAGRRMRARWLRAPLTGAAPGAYRLWLARQCPDTSSPPPRTGEPAIVALVMPGGAGGSDLAATLASLAAEGIPALVGTPGEIASRLDWTGRPWLLPLAAGDTLAPGAAAAYRDAVGEGAAGEGATARVAYADDDLVDAAGNRVAPHFKPDWNAELQRHHDYLWGAMIVRPTAAELAHAQAGSGEGADWPRALAQALAREAAPIHVRRVLHHRRARPAPRVPAAPTVPDGLPPVSVIVPTRDRADLLATCLAGLAMTRYPEIEVIVVDNGSDDPATLALLANLDSARHRVLRHPGAFNFAAINNRAAAIAHGRLLCLLNNDIEVMREAAGPDWLAILAVQALRGDVGAVGARLLYPDGRIQHAGVVLGLGTGCGHAHRRLRPDEEGYFRRHALPQFVSAVTAACLVVAADKYAAVGGLDEQAFPVAFNDVDLCLKLNTRGWRTLYEPRATLVHHESLSRGRDRDAAGAARLGRELAELRRRWVPEGSVDPFHHPALSRFSETFVVDV